MQLNARESHRSAREGRASVQGAEDAGTPRPQGQLSRCRLPASGRRSLPDPVLMDLPDPVLMDISDLPAGR